MGLRTQQHEKRPEVRQMKIGDLVKIPLDDYYWWGGKVGVVVDIETDPYVHPDRHALRLLVAGENPGISYVKFGANFVELISEAK